MRKTATHFAVNYGRMLLAVALDPKEIGRRLKRARLAKGWTQVVFATEHAHVSPSTISHWERGELPPVRELIRVSDLLDISPDSLVELDATDGDRESWRAELAEVRRGLADLLTMKEAIERIEALIRAQSEPPRGTATSV